jgi:bifunctional DNA-binding transcriptional regulator/antitoxin component of YhaV-PrlF toxin-antitoxin module
MPCWHLQNVRELELAAPPELSRMPNIRLKYDGWLALPVAARQKLGLSTGDELAIEIVGGAIVLRPARAGAGAGADRSPVEPVAPTVESQLAAAEPAPTVASPPVKRGPGRPRKTPVVPLQPVLKTRGRRKAAADGELPR